MGRFLADFWQPACRQEAISDGQTKHTTILGRSLSITAGAEDSPTIIADGSKVPGLVSGGIVWVWLAEGPPAPPPQFEFTTVPASHRDVRCAVTAANWLQTQEAVLDTAHLSHLHRSSIIAAAEAATFRNLAALFLDSAPRIETDVTAYGLREAALRKLPDGRLNARIREFVGPNHAMIPSEPDAERQHIISVPMDDTRTIQFIVTFNPFRPITEKELAVLWFDTIDNPDDIMKGAAGADVIWAQDRDAMREGHYSGLTNRQSLYEDLAICESMGPVVDHSKELLTSADITIAQVRRALLQQLDHAEKGQSPWSDALNTIRYAMLRSHIATIDPDEDWRRISAFADERPAPAVSA